MYSILSWFVSMVFTLWFGIQILFQIFIWVWLIHIWIEFKIVSLKIQKYNKGHVEIYRTHVDDLNQFHQHERNIDHLVKFYSKARKSPGFSMHECDAHIDFLSFCWLKFSGCYNETLRRSTRNKRPAISSDYKVYNTEMAHMEGDLTHWNGWRQWKMKSIRWVPTKFGT